MGLKSHHKSAVSRLYLKQLPRNSQILMPVKSKQNFWVVKVVNAEENTKRVENIFRKIHSMNNLKEYFSIPKHRWYHAIDIKKFTIDEPPTMHVS